MKNLKELSDIFTKTGDLQIAPDNEEVEMRYCSEQDELDMDPYDLMYNLFREVVELEHKVIRLRQEVNRLSPEKDIRRKPYQDTFSDLSCNYYDHKGYKKYVELYQEEPYDGEWGTFPDLGDSYEEHILGKKGTY